MFIQKSYLFFEHRFSPFAEVFCLIVYGDFGPKNRKIYGVISFFFVISWFFLSKKVSVAKIDQKNKRISLLKSRISLFNLTSGPKFGIKRGYHFIVILAFVNMIKNPWKKFAEKNMIVRVV